MFKELKLVCDIEDTSHLTLLPWDDEQSIWLQSMSRDAYSSVVLSKENAERLHYRLGKIIEQTGCKDV